jgi:hypothetical protein
MKIAILVIFCIGLSNVALAKDSDWKLCIGDVVLFDKPVKIAVNFFEHRNNKGPGRQSDISLVYGGNILRGSFTSAEGDRGDVMLKEEKSLFKGSVKMDYGINSLAIQGKLDLNGSTSMLTSKLKCETLGN